MFFMLIMVVGKVPVNREFSVIDGMLSVKKTSRRLILKWQSRDELTWEELDWDYDHLPVLSVYSGERHRGFFIPVAGPAEHLDRYLERFRGQNERVDHLIELYENGAYTQDVDVFKTYF